MKNKKYLKDEKIINEGDDGKEIYFIVSGSVRVTKSIESKDMELAVLGPENFFGEMGMLLESKRSATVTAIEPTEVLIGDLDAFIDSIKEDPSKAVAVINTMAKRLRTAHDIISRLEGKVRAYRILSEF